MAQGQSSIEVDLEARQAETIQFLETRHVLVLATCAHERVTARTVTFANDGLDIVFMSWGHNVKCAQIRENPRVALCRDNVQIEGRAEILGDPMAEGNRALADRYRAKLPRDYERFARQPGMVMVRVVPTLIRVFCQVDGQLFLDCLDLERGTAHREPLAGG